VAAAGRSVSIVPPWVRVLVTSFRSRLSRTATGAPSLRPLWVRFGRRECILNAFPARQLTPRFPTSFDASTEPREPWSVWSREALAEKSGVPAITTKQFENGGTDPRLSTLHKWCRALEAAGVLFLDEDDTVGPGVRLKESSRRQRRR
jgi:DNA-binding XRE family transcriptional regulator